MRVEGELTSTPTGAWLRDVSVELAAVRAVVGGEVEGPSDIGQGCRHRRLLARADISESERPGVRTVATPDFLVARFLAADEAECREVGDAPDWRDVAWISLVWAASL